MNPEDKIPYMRELEEEEKQFTEEERKKIQDTVEKFEWLKRGPNENLYHYKVRMFYAWWVTNKRMRMASWDWDNELTVRTHARHMTLPKPPPGPIRESVPKEHTQLQTPTPIKRGRGRPRKNPLNPNLIFKYTPRKRCGGKRPKAIRGGGELKRVKVEPEPVKEDTEPEEEPEEESTGSS